MERGVEGKNLNWEAERQEVPRTGMGVEWQEFKGTVIASGRDLHATT